LLQEMRHVHADSLVGEQQVAQPQDHSSFARLAPHAPGLR
jgi:hypothetical protein